MTLQAGVSVLTQNTAGVISSLDGSPIDALDLEIVPPRPGKRSAVLDLRRRDVGDLLAVVNEDVGLRQHADGTAGLVDDGSTADVAIDEKRDRLV